MTNRQSGATGPESLGIIYEPDCWTLIDLEDHVRVLAAWYGGFAGADRWKASSGIERVVDCEHHYEVHNSSGSTYLCSKNSERLNTLTFSILARISEQQPTHVITMQEFLERTK
jgi:hypothetical protein